MKLGARVEPDFFLCPLEKEEEEEGCLREVDGVICWLVGWL